MGLLCLRLTKRLCRRELISRGTSLWLMRSWSRQLRRAIFRYRAGIIVEWRMTVQGYDIVGNTLRVFRVSRGNSRDLWLLDYPYNLSHGVTTLSMNSRFSLAFHACFSAYAAIGPSIIQSKIEKRLDITTTSSACLFPCPSLSSPINLC
jgi:hypothetical protein